MTKVVQIQDKSIATLKKENAEIKSRSDRAEAESASLKVRADKVEADSKAKDEAISQLKDRADKAEAGAGQIKTEAAQTKARLDLLIRVVCEREPNAAICH